VESTTDILEVLELNNLNNEEEQVQLSETEEKALKSQLGDSFKSKIL
jgi:hypothetical protein